MKNFSILNFFIDGVRNARVIIEGNCNNLANINILIDGRNISTEDNIVLGREYIVDRITKNINKFNYQIKIPKYSRKIEVFYKKKLMFSRNISLVFRIFNAVKLTLLKILKIICRLPKVIWKVIKILWTRHRFIVPPRMLKKYFRSFIYNLKNKNVDELFYNPMIDNQYREWLEKNRKDIENKNFSYKPLISVIIPVYNASKKLLSECLDSILNQSYDNFEICLADDCSNNEETIKTLKEYEKKDKRIKIVYRKENGHISAASNTALSIAKGEFIALVDNDDVIDKAALYLVVKELNNNKKLDFIYSDEDKLDFAGKRCFPHFKPDFSIDTLFSSNYICHLTVIRKKIVDELKGFRGEYNGAQDYDLFLRVIDKTKNIYHIPKVLYHWRMTEGSTSSRSSNKNYAYLAGKHALEDYFKRNKIDVKVHLLEDVSRYKIEYLYHKEPMISIIIPTKDNSKILDNCLKSIFNKTSYKNYEVIVIDNNSCEKDTFKLLKKYKSKYNNFISYRYECPFNYSYLNNEGVKKANGEYIVLLNNDTEVISNDWLNIMVGYAKESHIGCVGVKLLYPNYTVQHCGVIVGMGGVAMHSYVGCTDNDLGYMGRLASVYDVSCVTAACLMVSREKYNKVMGLDENLKVAYNDVDFNLKLLDNGYNNVVIPYVKLLHHESFSRGSDMDKNKIKRFIEETNYICDKWQKKILSDSYYNPNFSYYCPFRLDKGVSKDE